MSDEARELALELRRHLAWLEEQGEKVILTERTSVQARVQARPVHPERSGAESRGQNPPRALTAAVPSTSPSRNPAPSDPSTSAGAYAQGERRAPPETPDRTLDEIRRELGDCRRCKLCEGRKQIVFGVGNPKADLVFVGEGPGADEDAQGIPFVGKAGQLLTKMIEAMGFSRDEVYICNVVKCRPPGNRNPEPDEIDACEPFLKAQLASIRPKAIVALGKFAAQTLLRDSTAITRLRGRWRKYEGIPLMPTFHPAYLLRDPSQKRLAWEDLQQVMALFGKQVKK